MDLDTVFEEVVARKLVNDEQPSLVGIFRGATKKNTLYMINADVSV